MMLAPPFTKIFKVVPGSSVCFILEDVEESRKTSKFRNKRGETHVIVCFSQFSQITRGQQNYFIKNT